MLFGLFRAGLKVAWTVSTSFFAASSIHRCTWPADTLLSNLTRNFNRVLKTVDEELRRHRGIERFDATQFLLHSALFVPFTIPATLFLHLQQYPVPALAWLLLECIAREGGVLGWTAGLVHTGFVIFGLESVLDFISQLNRGYRI
mmetsp:Transcript_19547/g.50063  ORF Transcript_19547/g.50063 Transcript_19547/m.50063 type:complete len:145 (-) Transcript_19547:771-1205(-)